MASLGNLGTEFSKKNQQRKQLSASAECSWHANLLSRAMPFSCVAVPPHCSKRVAENPISARKTQTDTDRDRDRDRDTDTDRERVRARATTFRYAAEEVRELSNGCTVPGPVVTRHVSVRVVVSVRLVVSVRVVISSWTSSVPVESASSH